MFKFGTISALVSVLLFARGVSEEPKTSDQKPVRVTKDKLLGKWKGPKEVPITLEFMEKKVRVVVSSNEGEKPRVKSVEWDYIIDDDGEWVILSPNDGLPGGLGNAKMNADGTLTVNIVPVPPVIDRLEPTRFTSVKPKDRK